MFRSLKLTFALSSMYILGCGTSPPAPGSAGGGGPDSGVPNAASLSVSPAARTVFASDDPLSIRATLVGASGPITWTLSGPGTLGATSGEQTTYTPPTTIDAQTTATVTASAGPTLSAVVTITVAPSTGIEVSGRVVGTAGDGLPGMRVAIGGKTRVTDAEGRFSIPGVTPPYDLAVASSGIPPTAGVYHGLTRPDPTLVFLFSAAGTEPSTGVLSGRVLGGDPIPSDGEFTGAVFASPETSRFITLGSRDYSLQLSWFGPTTTIGTVHVLQWKSPGGGRPPTSYTGFSSVTAVRVTDQSATGDASVQLFDPGTTSIAGDLVAPAGSAVSSRSLILEFADHALLPLGSDLDGDTHFSYPVPRNVTLTAVVTATAEFPSGAGVFRRESGIARGATDVGVVLPLPALPSTPDDGSADVSASTDFRWSPFVGGVHLLVFNGTATTPSYYVVTGETSTRIPDLPALGAALPPATSFSWFVVGLGPLASVDDYTGIGALIPPLGSLDESISDVRSFVTR